MYLQKAYNGNYYFRWRIPNKERTLYNNRSEIVKSLKTKNAKLARKKAKHIKNGLPILRERLLYMTNSEVDEIVKNWLEERLEADLNGRIEKSNIEGAKKLPYTKTFDNTLRNLGYYQEELANLRTNSVFDLGETLIIDGEKINPEHNKGHKRLLFQLLRANVELFKVLTERNKGEFGFPQTQSIKENKLTYGEAVKEYLPYLLSASKSRVKNKKSEIPTQYLATEKWINNRFLLAVGEETLLPDRASECSDILTEAFKRDDFTVGRDSAEYIKAFYLWLFNNNHIPTNISTQLFFDTLPKNKREAFTPEMVHKILTETTGDLNLLFRIYLYTGMRRSELFQCAFDESETGFKILQGKNKNALRFIPQHRAIEDISPEIIQRIQTVWSADKVGRTLNDWITKHISKENKYTLHSTRHCFNTWMRRAGVDSTLMKIIMGHEGTNTGDMSDYYTTYFSEPNDKRNAVNAVDYTYSESE
jgi:integrase